MLAQLRRNLVVWVRNGSGQGQKSVRGNLSALSNASRLSHTNYLRHQIGSRMPSFKLTT